MEEFLIQLEEIARITFDIQIIYSKLTLLEVSKDIEPNYYSEKKELLDSLQLLLDEENEAYKLLNDDYMIAASALNTFCKLENDNVSEKVYLCQKRIKNKLKNIVYETGLYEENEDFIDSYLEEEFFSYLFFDRKFTKEEMLVFIEKVLPVINSSIARHYVNTLNEDIKNPSNFDYRRLLINLKFDWIFETSGVLEKENLSSGFNNLKMTLDSETSINGLSPIIKKEFFNYQVKNKLLDVLIIMGAVVDIELVLGEMEWFKTYLLYLDKDTIKDIKDMILGYNFQNKDIKSKLLKTITEINTLKTIHNKDSKTLAK